MYEDGVLRRQAGGARRRVRRHWEMVKERKPWEALLY